MAKNRIGRHGLHGAVAVVTVCGLAVACSGIPADPAPVFMKGGAPGIARQQRRHLGFEEGDVGRGIIGRGPVEPLGSLRGRFFDVHCARRLRGVCGRALPTALVAEEPPARSRVVVVKQSDRAKAVAACFEAFAFRACDGRDVAVKANFNSADPFPASTHPATLGALLAELKRRGAQGLTLGERSGMGDTRAVLEQTGAAAAVAAAGGKVVVLDDVGRDA